MKKLIVLLGVFVSFSCACKKNTEESITTDVAYEVIYSANEHTLDVEELRLINSEEELYKAYAEINKTRMPGLEIPEIDFSEETLMMLRYKITEEGYNDVNIESIKGKEKSLRVNLKQTLDTNKLNDIIHKYPFFILKLKGKYDTAKIHESE